MKRKVLLLLCAGLLLTGCAGRENSEDGKEPEMISLDLTGGTQNDEARAETETTIDNGSSGDSSEIVPSEEYQETQEQKLDSPIEISTILESDKSAQDLYMQFINNGSTATVGDDYPENDYLVFKLERGDSYTFAELGQYVNQRYLDPEYSEKTSYDYAQYAYVDCPDNDSGNLLIKFVGLNIYAPDDDSFAVYVLTESNGQLYLTDEYECWARSAVTAYRNGLCSSDGSSGAGDHIAGIDAIMSNGRVTSVYYIETLNGEWTRSVSESIYNEVFGVDTLVLLNVSIYTIGENQYYTYDLSECTQEQIPLCETYINRCRDEAGINWITDEEAQALIKERFSSMGVDYDSIGQQQEPEWITI